MRRVIMIDDDTSILEIFQLVFERAGYSITVFDSPDLILDNRFDEPDIFIIDKQLNGTDGGDLCRYLKQRKMRGDTPVILFSANPQINQHALNAGADGFLEKPFKNKELLSMVDKLLAAH